MEGIFITGKKKRTKKSTTGNIITNKVRWSIAYYIIIVMMRWCGYIKSVPTLSGNAVKLTLAHKLLNGVHIFMVRKSISK